MRFCQILGVTITDLTMEAAVARVGALIRAERAARVFFANAHTLNHASASPELRDILNGGDLVLGDGTGVRWAARLQGLRLRANPNGTDLTPLVMEQVPGIRCFLLGSAPERTQAILAKARARFPEVEFVGTHHGYLDAALSETVVEEINRSGANLVLVAMGNPLQERWIEAHGPRLPRATCMGVGALLDYWEGSLVRAPLWMRKIGSEWVYRVFTQRGRAMRYIAGNPVFVARVLRWLPRDRAATRRMAKD